MYIESAGQTPACTFTITTSAPIFNTRMWNVSDEIFIMYTANMCSGITMDVL